MKNNTTHHTAHELVNLIIEVKKAEGQYDAGYPYATGVLISIIDGVRNGFTTLQSSIDSNYELYKQDLAKLQRAA